ncbi:hypothetical protein FA13DRAFT_1816395 [Coprinellus micaceus]|uniref:CHAT domain-containing protein n=2 Tax=Coprinellus micaceus TaxID=71717 RepID=A0A4Y7T047_COPMI|nr:hypothetical protein FA13DRAFT_1816395 [Coprinellus micaceus]
MNEPDIDAWIQVIVTGSTSEGLSVAFTSLETAFEKEYELTKSTSGVQGAVNAMQNAVDVIPRDDRKLPTLLKALGVCQRIKFSTPSNYLLDIVASISNHRSARSIAEANASSDLSEILHSLSLSLWKAFEFTREIAYLEEAIEIAEKSVACTFDNHPNLYIRIYDLGRLFDARLTVRQIFADGEHATSLILRAANLAGEKGDPYLVADMVDTLGFAMLNKYSTRLERADASEATLIYQTALEVAPDDHPNLPGILQNFGRAMTVSFYTDEDPVKLDEALTFLRRSVELTKEGHYDLPRRLHGLGVVLRIKFCDTQNLSLIQEAISCFDKAFQLEPRGSGKIGMRALEVAEAIALRCGVTGEMMDLEEAISLVKEDIEVMEGRGQGEFVQVLEDLGRTFVQRFKVNHHSKDIVEAIATFERAIRSIPSESYLIPSLLNNLGTAYEERYAADNHLPDLDTEIALRRKAMTATPQDHSRLPWYLISLSISLLKRYLTVSSFKDVEEAIRIQQEVLQKVSKHHGMLGCWNMELAYSFLAIHGKTGSWDALDRALELMRKSFSFVLDTGLVDIPGRSTALGMMSTVMRSSQEEVRKAVGYYKEAALASYGNTPSRLQAAQKWAEHARTFDIHSSLEGYGRAVELISEFVGLEQTRSRRHQNIAQISNLSRAAAATALEAGDAGKALNWLERGRCLVWSQLNSLRTPVDELRHQDPSLADQVVALSKGLEESSGQASGMINGGLSQQNPHGAASSVDLAIQWKEVIARVRQKLGFEDFLGANPIDMRELPACGTVVIINVHETRCDALALQSSWANPLHVPLPHLSLEKTRKMVDHLRESQRKGSVRIRGAEELEEADAMDDERGVQRYRKKPHNHDLASGLRDLWNWVVHPILGAIGYMDQGRSERRPSRIWWCPTGPLASLPLHAAGTYDGDHTTTRDFAISSYIPNIATLLKKTYPEKKDGALTKDGANILIVSQPATPGHCRLPGVLREVAAIQEITQASTCTTLHLEGDKATVKTALDSVPSHTSIHLACHASQHLEEPLESGFALHDGKLKLSDIIRENMQDAELAFLSACQTSTGDEKLSEEAMHLAAGMLAAGYKGVVATMWSIKDQYAPQVAKDFYRELVRLGTEENGGFGAGRAAEALHYAVGELQAKVGRGEEGLLVWAPYVHFGR